VAFSQTGILGMRVRLGSPGRHIWLMRSNWMMQMRRPFWRGLFYPLAVVLVLGGCTTYEFTNTFSSPARSTGAKNYRFSDIPIPAGMSLVSNDSFILETPDTRAGQLVYSGYVKFPSVVRFYRQKMPNHGWRLLSSIERGEAALTYEKPGCRSSDPIRS